jgi:hypothetical protein
MNHWLSGAIVTASLMLFTSNAGAHIKLGSPVARDPSLKAGPCGTAGSVRGTNVTTFEPGEKITVTWTETVDHPGHFRISFDENGTDDFVDPKAFDDFDTAPSVIVDNIADKVGSMQMYSQEVTLPNVECDNCTLQLIQVMTDKPPFGGGNDLYYQCADLVLKGGGSPSGASSSAASGSSSAASGSSSAASGSSSAASGSGGGAAAGGGGDGEGGGSSGGNGGGCSCIVNGGNEGGALSALALVALAWLAKARRTRR